jgi:hypothetical protein
VTINRVQSTGFAQISNDLLRDSRLSFRARGIMAMVMSHSGEWDAPRDWLVSQSNREGREAIQTALNELTALGYRVVTKERQKDGTWRTVVDWYQYPMPRNPSPVEDDSVLTEDPTEGRVSRPPVHPTAGEPVLPPEHHLQNTKSGSASPPLAVDDPRVTEFSLMAPPVPTRGNSRKRPATPIPPEWLAMDVPPRELVAKAREVGLAPADIGVTWRAFTSWHAAKDTRYARWEWTWRNWVEKEVTRNKTKTKTALDPKTGIAYGPPGRPDDAWMYRQDFDVNPLEGIER